MLGFLLLFPVENSRARAINTSYRWLLSVSAVGKKHEKYVSKYRHPMSRNHASNPSPSVVSAICSTAAAAAVPQTGTLIANYDSRSETALVILRGCVFAHARNVPGRAVGLPLAGIFIWGGFFFFQDFLDHPPDTSLRICTVHDACCRAREMMRPNSGRHHTWYYSCTNKAAAASTATPT